MKKILYRFLKSKLVRMLVNPRYGKVTGINSGHLYVVPGQCNRLGDLIMNNHFIQQLQKFYYVSHGVTDWYLKKNQDFLENHCYTTDILVFPTNWWKRILFIFKAKRKKIDAVVMLPYHPEPIELYLYLAGIPVIVAMQGSSAFSTHHFNFAKFSQQNHYTSAANCIMDALGSDRNLPLDVSPWFPFKKMQMDECRNTGGVSLAVHIGGATYWLRRWPAEKFTKVCRQFLDNYEGRIFLVGGADEHEDNEKLKETLALQCNAEGRIMNFCGASLNQFANVLHNADLFLGNDSGPMHMATALRKRVLAIFSSANIAYLNPTYIDKKNITIFSDLECVPCKVDFCKLPADKQYSCLNDLSTRIVWNRLQSVLDEMGAPRIQSRQPEEVAG
ncbi:MAG TPA: glycosyltransferase family 9 protein [Chitinophagaceae bacterium]|nr:glycosyltransferase family 9 protein [Chitinophagaceae bacterium]